jgi:cell wall-associated NlpC family hydrolase
VNERGQVSSAVVGLAVLVLLGAAVLVYLGRIAAGGGQAQRAADLASLAAARVLAADPSAGAGEVRSAAAPAARANGATLLDVRVLRSGGIVRGVEVSAAVGVAGDVPAAGPQQSLVPAGARAGVSYAVSLPGGSFRPVDLHGARGRRAVVAAAEAQLGWPYVWGGESPAEGGFDCSGLVAYAFAAAGAPLPGRPTAAGLWAMAQPIAAPALQPGDLTFAGAASGAPYHVAVYAGGGMVVVARHRGAPVSLQPLAAVPWDGFGRLLPPEPGAPLLVDATRSAALAAGAPPDVVAAELALGLARDARTAARELAAAQRRHGGDLADALGDVLGDRSAAALVLRAASGPALGAAFSADVRLLPRPREVLRSAAPPTATRVAPARAARPGPSGAGVGGLAGGAVDTAERGLEQLSRRGSRVSLQAFAAVRHLVRLGLTGAALLLPDERMRDAANLVGNTWDALSASTHAAAAWASRAGLVLRGARLLGARVSLVGSVLSFVLALRGIASARSRRARLRAGAMALGSAVETAGWATAGTSVVMLGVASAEIPPVGLALIAVGTVIVAGVAIYDNAELLRRGALRAGRAAAAAWRLAAGACGGAVRAVKRAGSAVLERGRSLAASALDAVTPW